MKLEDIDETDILIIAGAALLGYAIFTKLAETEK